jgi:hypothetical protein
MKPETCTAMLSKDFWQYECRLQPKAISHWTCFRRLVPNAADVLAVIVSRIGPDEIDERQMVHGSLTVDMTAGGLVPHLPPFFIIIVPWFLSNTTLCNCLR